MEPTNNNASNSVSHEVFDDHLEKIVQEFNEFQGKMSEKSRTGAMKLEDLIDMFIDSGGVNVNSPVDLNESESTLLPHQVQSAQVQSTHGFNIHREVQESENMINEMTESEDTSQNDTGNFPDFSPTVKTNSRVGAGGTGSSVTHIRYGGLNCPGVADHVIGSVFGCSAETVFRSVMKTFRTPGAGGKNLWQQVGGKESGDATTSRKSIKRKYKQIIETEEETAHQMEITTIKNREASAKARAKRQAHSAYIWSQLLKLREKNEHLRKSVTFLEGHKRNNLCPEPLRRTISDPQQISFMDIYT